MAQRLTRAERRHHLEILQQALWEDGKDRDPVTKAFAAFTKFDRNGIDAVIDFYPGQKMPEDVREFALKLCKEQMEDTYNGNGFIWDDEEKEEELVEEAARFLVVKDKATSEMLGYCDFRFTVQGDLVEGGGMKGYPALFVNDLQLTPAAQRKGLGRHLLILLELVARKNNMSFVMLKVYKGKQISKIPRRYEENAVANAFITSQLKGYALDHSFIMPTEPISVYQKCINPTLIKAAAPEPEAASAASTSTPTKQARAQLPVSPVKSPGTAAEAEEDEESQADGEKLLEQLCSVFKTKHGREPTEGEVGSWRGRLKNANAGTAAEIVAECMAGGVVAEKAPAAKLALPSFGAQKVATKLALPSFGGQKVTSK